MIAKAKLINNFVEFLKIRLEKRENSITNLKFFRRNNSFDKIGHATV